MLNINTTFDKTENFPKLSIGPTFANPGPTFPKVVATAVKFVVKSNSLKVKIKREIMPSCSSHRAKNLVR